MNLRRPAQRQDNIGETVQSVKSDGLTGHARRGLLWGGGFRAFHIVLQFGLSLILARLLAPEDFGTYAVVAGLVGFLNAVSFENFTRHILQVRDEEAVPYQDHFTAAVVLQFLIFLLTNLVGVTLQWVPEYSEVAGYIHVLSPIILLSSVGGYHYICLEKQLNWSRYRRLQMLGVLLTAATVLGLALSGAGVLALLAGPSVKYLPPTIDLFFLKRWRPTWQFRWTSYQPAFHFGLNRLASSAALKGRAMLEANWLLLLTSLATLGFLNRAVSFSQLICLQLATVVGQSLYPVLTRIEPRSDRYREASALVFQGMVWLLLPVVILAGLLARPVIVTLYGDTWIPSVKYVPLTLMIGFVGAMGQIGYYLLLASCQQGRCLTWDFLRLTAVAAALAAWPMYQSITGYLWTIAVCELSGIVLLLAWLSSSRMASLTTILRDAAPGFIAGAAAAVCVLPLHADIQRLSLFAPAAVAFAAAFGTVYVAVLRLLFSRQLQRLTRVIPLGTRLNRLLLLPHRIPG